MGRVRKRPAHLRARKPRTGRTVKGGKLVPMSAIRKHNRRRKASSLEKTVYGWLDEMKISYRKEYPVGRCHVDLFFEPRTVVELNGCHWHGCSVCNKELSAGQKLAQQKDARRYAFFRNRKNLDVVVIWECEVDREPERVKAQLKMLAEQE